MYVHGKVYADNCANEETFRRPEAFSPMGHDPHEAVAAVTLGRWSWMTGPHAHHRRPGARWLTMLMLVGSLVIGPVADAQETSGPTEQAATSEPASRLLGV